MKKPSVCNAPGINRSAPSAVSEALRSAAPEEVRMDLLPQSFAIDAARENGAGAWGCGTRTAATHVLMASSWLQGAGRVDEAASRTDSAQGGSKKVALALGLTG